MALSPRALAANLDCLNKLMVDKCTYYKNRTTETYVLLMDMHRKVKDNLRTNTVSMKNWKTLSEHSKAITSPLFWVTSMLGYILALTRKHISWGPIFLEEEKNSPNAWAQTHLNIESFLHNFAKETAYVFRIRFVPKRRQEVLHL